MTENVNSNNSSTIIPFLSELQVANRFGVPREIIDKYNIKRGDKYIIYLKPV